MTAREQLTGWVKQQHKGQLIRDTLSPYFDHLSRVAVMAGRFTELGYETGLCHDLFEKTAVNADQLCTELGNFGYDDGQITVIVDSVTALTDVFTRAAYPDLKKKVRKAREAKRLATIGPLAQTVKYADLIDNIHWMKTHRPEKTAVYLEKKRQLLKMMDKGDAELLAILTALCGIALEQFFQVDVLIFDIRDHFSETGDAVVVDLDQVVEYACSICRFR